MSSRSYPDAIDALNSLQSNAATLDAVRQSGGRLSQFAIPEMLEYLERIGYEPSRLNALNVIHITGTKGKGSTSAFVDSILRSSRPDWKIGLYTSPHLVVVRERIRINGAPISEADFAKYFFQVWDRLVENNTRKVPTTPPMPGYFRFLTLMAFHVFSEMKVDATVLEVGVGGTYDSTNIVPKPVTTGITALGIDHVSVLGKTIEEIAWQKGGIFKPDVPAFTVEQPENAMEVLRSRATELKAQPLKVATAPSELKDIQLGIAGAHQAQNATLAIELCKSFLDIDQDAPLPESFIRGLRSTKWPGRCQVIHDESRENTTWFLDGAHTVESLECCLRWFVTPGIGISEATGSPRTGRRVLVFNCTSGRSGESFLKTITDTIGSQLTQHGSKESLPFFDHVVFCTNVTYADGHFKGDLTSKSITADEVAELKTQQALASAWQGLFPGFPESNIHVLPSVEHAIRTAEKIRGDGQIHVLVTGSLHLVGGIIEAAQLSRHLNLS